MDNSEVSIHLVGSNSAREQLLSSLSPVRRHSASPHAIVPAAIVALDRQAALDHLKQMSGPVFMVFSEDFSVSELNQLYNKQKIFAVIEENADRKEVISLLRSACEALQEKARYSSLLEQTRQQNRRLEGLSDSLNEKVQERTREVADSKSRLAQRVSHLRELTQFIQSLSNLMTVEELLTALGRELKAFRQVKGLVLRLESPGLGSQIFSCYTGVVSRKQARFSLPKSLRIEVNSKEDSQILANELDRPVSKVVRFPLPLNGLKAPEDRFQACLYFEHGLESHQLENFLKFLNDRLQPLSMALERVLLEQEMKSAAAMWEQTFDGLGHPVAVITRELRVLRGNRFFKKFRFSTNCFTAFSNLNQACPGCPIAGKEKVHEQALGTVRVNGRAYEVHSYPIRFEEERESEAGTYVHQYEDVTEENELRGRMIQNEKMAAIGTLAGSIAHELNNPLTGIRSMAQILMQESSADSEFYQDLEEVEKAADRCQSIIKNLREFSIDQERGVEASICALNDIVEKTLPLLKAAMRDFGREVELTSENTNVRVEPQLLQQVIFNLINNACQAMSGSQGSISIQTRVNNPFVELVVVDTGPGIPESHLESIFDPFFTTKSAGQGTGLGLSMSRTVMREFGGDLRVTSELNRGSCFIASLPLVEERKT